MKLLETITGFRHKRLTTDQTFCIRHKLEEKKQYNRTVH